MSNNHVPKELMAALARVEERQAAYEQVAHRMLDMLEVHNEKLDAILEAATRELGPSPVLGVLAEILSSLREQETLLAELPAALAGTIRGESRRESEAGDMERKPAVPRSFADRAGENGTGERS